MVSLVLEEQLARDACNPWQRCQVVHNHGSTHKLHEVGQDNKGMYKLSSYKLLALCWAHTPTPARTQQNNTPESSLGMAAFIPLSAEADRPRLGRAL